jgi:hypothetical protein
MAPNDMQLIAMSVFQLPKPLHRPLIELCCGAPSRQSLHPIRIADFTTLEKKNSISPIGSHITPTMIKAAHEFNGQWALWGWPAPQSIKPIATVLHMCFSNSPLGALNLPFRLWMLQLKEANVAL